MNHFFCALLLALYPTLSCFAQDEASVKKRLPEVIVQTGIGSQWFGKVYKTSTLSIERPLGSFWRLGLQGWYYFNYNADVFSVKQLLSGYEAGFYAKHFPHKQPSGRMSGFYLGPEIRFGQRRLQATTENVLSFPPSLIHETYRERLLKFLLRLGFQWQLGHATLDLSAPLGMEIYHSTLKGYNIPKGTQFVLLPMLQLGVAF